MLKNWLIRTKSNHILGPISKAKTCELYKNGSIKPDDELCSGNGYWFFVKESNLIQRYLLGDEVQTYNPISEAHDALSSQGQQTPSHATTKEDHHDDEVKMPTDDDLAFPDMGGGVQTTSQKAIQEAPPTPIQAVPSIPDIPEIKNKSTLNNVHIEPPKRRDIVKPKKDMEDQVVIAPKSSEHKKLYTMAIVILLMAIAVLLYRKYQTKTSVPISSLISPISSAYADDAELKKKN